MLKFIKQNMETIDGIEIYPMIAFILFMSVFVISVVLVIMKDKNSIKEISSLPLDNEPLNLTTDEKA